MNLREHVKEIEEKYQAGQNLFRRKSVGLLLERISQLEQSAQHSVQRIGGTDFEQMDDISQMWSDEESANR